MNKDSKPKPTNTTFHQRCASALTHPVTIAALAVLLINDLVLKALWPNPWTTGKLSDLAWVIFASPLLAFIISFPARHNNTAQRVAFITAYIGLPALYAAFNTFEPLHDLIIQGLLMLSGASVGSPFDPTDSLVIPIGLTIALWVWKRPAASATSLRLRLALLTAGAASFATIATPSPVMSDRLVGHLDEGTLILNLAFATYTSSDGGLSWLQSFTHIDKSAVEWGSSTVQTPKGTYTIDGLEIIRSHSGETETVYSPSYLQRDADIRFQEHLDRRFFEACPYTCPSSNLLNLVYDARSGNIVAATGAQGVVVGTIDGNWMQIAVGRYGPTDFSLRNKVNALLGEGAFWLAAVTISISGTALGLGILRSMGGPPERQQAEERRAAQNVRRRRFFGRHWDKQKLMRYAALAAIIVFICGLFLLEGVAILALIVVFLISVIAAIPRATHSSEETNAGAVIGMVSLTISAIASIIGMTQLLTSAPPYGHGSDLSDPVAIISLTVGGVSGLIAFMAFRPPLRRLPIVLAVFLGMIALFILAFVIGVVQGFNLTAAKFYAVILIVLAAFTLAFLLGGGQFLLKRNADRQE